MSRHASKFIPQPKKSHRGKDSDAPRRAPARKADAEPPRYRPHETFEAVFLGHPEGTGGFLRPKGAQKGQGLDLLVDWRDASGAIHGDRVAAEVSGESFDGRLRGRVVRIIARGENPIPAHLQKQPWGWRAVPLEPRLQQIVSVPATDLAEDGDLVSIRLDPDPKLPQLKGVVLARLGRLTDLKIENKLTAALYNLRTTFPDAVMDELAPFPTTIPEEWLRGREDLARAAHGHGGSPDRQGLRRRHQPGGPARERRRRLDPGRPHRGREPLRGRRRPPWTRRPGCGAPPSTSPTSASPCSPSASPASSAPCGEGVDRLTPHRLDHPATTTWRWWRRAFPRASSAAGSA